ncbi:MAG: PDZ domain-containing protein, partial [Coleofasciculus sp. C2-GNP5-27]
VADTDLSDFFRRYIDGTEELPFDEYLEPFGLTLTAVEDEDAQPYFGVIVKTENGQEVVKFVNATSPAGIAGVDAGDQLLAIDGWRVSADQLSDRLKDYHPGDTIQVTVFHQDELCTLPVTLGDSQPTRYQVVQIENPSATQKQNLAGWLHRDC